MSPYREDYKQGQRDFLWTLPRVLGSVLVAIVAIYLLAVALTPLTIGFGWFKGEANLRSFSHVQDTYREAFDDVNAMEANVRQACSAKKLVADAKASGDTVTYNQRVTQATTYENNYNRVKGEYQAYMNDHFRGGVNHPSQLPLPYPEFLERLTAVCSTPAPSMPCRGLRWKPTFVITTD